MKKVNSPQIDNKTKEIYQNVKVILNQGMTVKLKLNKANYQKF